MIFMRISALSNMEKRLEDENNTKKIAVVNILPFTEATGFGHAFTHPS